MLAYDDTAKLDNTPSSTVETARISSSPSTMRQRLSRVLLTFVKIFFPSIIFVKFFLSSVIPPMADNIIPLYFTANIPDDGLAIASQFMFISIILEVIQEGVGNSLFHFVGTHYKVNKELALVAFKLGLAVLLLGGIILTIIMLALTPQFVNLIDTPELISDATKDFLYTSSFSFIPILFRTAFTNYLLISTSTWLVVAQIITVVISFTVNFFMFGEHSFSLHWGIDKLGIYKVVQSSLAGLVSIIFVLIVEKMGPITFFIKVPFFKDLKANFKAFFKVSWGNFADSIVRNFFYFVVTLKFMNNLGADEAAAWNLLNTIIWGVILIPAYVVANYVKVHIGLNNSKSKIRQVAKKSAFCLLAWICVMTVLTWTMWPALVSLFSKYNEKVESLAVTMLYNVGWIFIIFACNNAIDSFFLGTGKTEYVFYQSILTNLLVYLVPWILYLVGVLTPTYWWVLGLYIAGMLVDFCLTCYFCITVWKSIPVD